MTPADAAETLSLCSAFDNRTVSRVTAEAWAAALPDLRVEDVKVAIVNHYGTSREWIMPADVRTAVRALRASRLAAAPAPQPPETIDPDNVPLTLAWTRARNTAIADGCDIEEADAIACAEVGAPVPALEVAPRPVAALVAQAAIATHVPVR